MRDGIPLMDIKVIRVGVKKEYSTFHFYGILIQNTIKIEVSRCHLELLLNLLLRLLILSLKQLENG